MVVNDIREIENLFVGEEQLHKIEQVYLKKLQTKESLNKQK